MPAISDRALAVGNPVTTSWECIRMPLFGVLWVVINVSLVALGIQHWVALCLCLPGRFDQWLAAVGDCAHSGMRTNPSERHRFVGGTYAKRSA